MSHTFTHALVTGGAGFIGSNLVKCLLNKGMSVTVIDNLSMGAKSSVDTRARFIEGDIRNEEDVRTALEGVDCVFHLAACVTIRASFDKFYDDADTNIMGTMMLLKCVDSANVRQFTFASSMAIYADSPTTAPVAESYTIDPQSPYGVGKLASEIIGKQILGQKGIPLSVVRYFNTYGPGQTLTPYVGVITIFINKLLKGEQPVIFGDGEQQRDFTHVDDIVSGTMATLAGPPGTYNLGTGKASSVNDIASMLIAHINPDITPLYAAEQVGELKISIADILKAQNNLNYSPSHDIASDIKSVIEHIKTR